METAQVIRDLYVSQESENADGKGFSELDEETKAKLKEKARAEAVQSILRSNHFAYSSLKNVSDKLQSNATTHEDSESLK